MGRSLAAMAAIALALPATAAAHWGQTRTIGMGPVLSQPALAVAGRGDAVVAWAGEHGVEVAFAPAGSWFGKPQLVPGSDVSGVPVEVVVALGEDGRTVVGWTDCVGDFADPESPGDTTCREKVRASFRLTRDGGFRRALTLSRPGQNGEAPEVAARGTHVTVAFADAEAGTVFAARLGRQGFVRARKVAIGQAGNEPAVTVGARGAETFVVQGDPGVLGVERAASGAIRTVMRVTRSTPYYRVIGRAGRPGEQAAVWDTQSSGPGTSFRAGVRRNGHRMRVRRLVRTSGGAVYDGALAGSRAGWFVAAVGTHRLGTGISHGIRYSMRAPGKSFQKARYARDARTSSAPSVAIDSSGRAVLAWLDAGGRYERVAVAAPGSRAFRPGRRFSLAHAADPTCDPESTVCALPHVALDPRGRGYLVWIGGRRRVEAARYRPGR